MFAALGLLAGMLWLGEWKFGRSALDGAMLLLLAALLASVPFAALDSGPAVAAGSLARVALFVIPVYVFFYTASGPAGLPRMDGAFCPGSIGSRPLRPSSRASISTFSSLHRPATDRSMFGWIPESTAAPKGCSTRPAPWAISAPSSWS